MNELKFISNRGALTIMNKQSAYLRRDYLTGIIILDTGDRMYRLAFDKGSINVMIADGWIEEILSSTWWIITDAGRRFINGDGTLSTPSGEIVLKPAPKLTKAQYVALEHIANPNSSTYKSWLNGNGKFNTYRALLIRELIRDHQDGDPLWKELLITDAGRRAMDKE